MPRVPVSFGFALALLLPLLMMAFTLTGPHSVEVAALWLLPVPLMIVVDSLPLHERRNAATCKARWLAESLPALVAVLAPLNLIALGFFVHAFFNQSMFSPGATVLDVLALRMLGGTCFCCAVIAPAHELMHRRSRGIRMMSRWLLMLVFADGFYLSHAAGHHRHLGCSSDPSTARMGELYPDFFWRSLKTQWRIAWVHHRKAFLRGLSFQVMLLITFGMVFGIPAALVWLYLSWVAIRLLEAVNYFQHYGLTAGSGHEAATAWRCDRALSYFVFLGLTRHADHHQRSGLAYTELSPHDGPELPLGYFGTALWVKNHSRSYSRMASDRLKRLAESRCLSQVRLD
jgi:alkane 1-monooxygenase